MGNRAASQKVDSVHVVLLIACDAILDRVGR